MPPLQPLEYPIEVELWRSEERVDVRIDDASILDVKPNGTRQLCKIVATENRQCRAEPLGSWFASHRCLVRITLGDARTDRVAGGQTQQGKVDASETRRAEARRATAKRQSFPA